MPAQRPNVLFVFCDELRAHAVPPTRTDPTVTPHLDFKGGSCAFIPCAPFQNHFDMV